MTPKIFDKNDKYTRTALEIEGKFEDTLRPIFNQFVKKGFSSRDLAHILHLVIFALESDSIMWRDAKTKYPEHCSRLGCLNSITKEEKRTQKGYCQTCFDTLP